VHRPPPKRPVLLLEQELLGAYRCAHDVVCSVMWVDMSRSGRSRELTRAERGRRRHDEDEEEFFPDVERDALRRRRVLGFAPRRDRAHLRALRRDHRAYFMLQPKPPTFQYEVRPRLHTLLPLLEGVTRGRAPNTSKQARGTALPQV